MRLTPPTKTVFYVSVILMVVALIGYFVSIPFVSAYAFWFAIVGGLLLAAGNYFKGF